MLDTNINLLATLGGAVLPPVGLGQGTGGIGQPRFDAMLLELTRTATESSKAKEIAQVPDRVKAAFRNLLLFVSEASPPEIQRLASSPTQQEALVRQAAQELGLRPDETEILEDLLQIALQRLGTTSPPPQTADPKVDAQTQARPGTDPGPKGGTPGAQNLADPAAKGLVDNASRDAVQQPQGKAVQIAARPSVPAEAPAPPVPNTVPANTAPAPAASVTLPGIAEAVTSRSNVSTRTLDPVAIAEGKAQASPFADTAKGETQGAPQGVGAGKESSQGGPRATGQDTALRSFLSQSQARISSTPPPAPQGSPVEGQPAGPQAPPQGQAPVNADPAAKAAPVPPAPQGNPAPQAVPQATNQGAALPPAAAPQAVNPVVPAETQAPTPLAQGNPAPVASNRSGAVQGVTPQQVASVPVSNNATQPAAVANQEIAPPAENAGKGNSQVSQPSSNPAGAPTANVPEAPAPQAPAPPVNLKASVVAAQPEPLADPASKVVVKPASTPVQAVPPATPAQVPAAPEVQGTPAPQQANAAEPAGNPARGSDAVPVQPGAADGNAKAPVSVPQGTGQETSPTRNPDGGGDKAPEGLKTAQHAVSAQGGAVEAPAFSAQSINDQAESVVKDYQLRENVLRQVSAKLANIEEGTSQIRIELEPRNLGKLEIVLTTHEGRLVARLVASNAEVRDVIAANLQQFQQALENKGMHVQELSVAVKADVNSNSQSRAFDNQPWMFRQRQSAEDGQGEDNPVPAWARQSFAGWGSSNVSFLA